MLRSLLARSAVGGKSAWATAATMRALAPRSQATVLRVGAMRATSVSNVQAARQWLLVVPRRTFASSPKSKAEKMRRESMEKGNKRMLLYLTGVAIAWVGLSYAFVPLYKIFCKVTGFGGTTQRVDLVVADKLTPREDAKPIRITFDGGVSAMMPWSFRPQQRELVLVPGETALAFYTAKNKTDKAITGVATYNVYPPQAGVYFNKIQCFCFEEQRLKANEEIDMPVFFFIDPEICDDPSMSAVNNITLSYTFFKTDDVNEEDVEDDDA